MKIFPIFFVYLFHFNKHLFAKDVYLSCESSTKKKTSFIINEEKKV